MSTTRLEDIQRAVQMAVECKRVDYAWQAPKETAYTAEIWCNTIGECVQGHGPTAWAAVQAAHTLRSMKENKII